MAIEKVKGKEHLVIKRDGRLEKYKPSKLKKVALWACNGNENFAKILLDSFSIKIYNKIRIEVLFDSLISTAKAKINPLYPFWDEVARNLLLLKLHKEVWGENAGKYPDYQELVTIGLRYGVYNKEVFDSFDDFELKELGNMIDPSKDLKFSYKGLFLQSKKNCLNHTKTKKLELPQHSYLRSAIYKFYKDDNRMERIKQEYLDYANHKKTRSTPDAVNAATNNPQLASCVLNTMDDDTWNITDTQANMAQYSKFSGGLGLDVSHLRASGSAVKGNRGVSSGPINFIKSVEGVVGSFDQGGTRSGAAVITYPFWHYDVEDMIPLKDNGGSEDKRARHLQYSMRIHNLLIKRVMNDENISLFDPHEVPKLENAFGDDFDTIYEEYERKGGIKRKTIKAQDLFFKYLKYRQETGNLYATFIDNINMQNMTNRWVGSSNLCQEITIPSRASKLLKQEILYTEDDEAIIRTDKTAGEIGLCNLVSVNLLEYYKMNRKDQKTFIYNMLRGMDNVIDYQFYPVKEGKYSNQKERPIGVGVLNYTALLAYMGIKITDEKSLEITHQIFERLSFDVLEASNMLAEERGTYKGYNKSNWKNGLPIDFSILNNQESELNFDLLEDWDLLRTKIKRTGVRFSLHMAIAPTATSGKVLNATESIEPVLDLFYIEEGTDSLPTLAFNLNEFREFYVSPYQVDNLHLIRLAAIRQKFFDQSQSINLYYTKPDSAKELAFHTFYAIKLGVKTLYYLKTPKADNGESTEHICESCT
jgi:ribonucleoside-diphosphate reductase alpha chain